MNKKKFLNKDNKIINRIPINRHLLINSNSNITKNYRYNKIDKDYNYISENTEPMIIRPISSRKNENKKMKENYSTHSYKESNNITDIYQKCNIGNIINNIIYVNNIIKKSENSLSKSFKINK